MYPRSPFSRLLSAIGITSSTVWLLAIPQFSIAQVAGAVVDPKQIERDVLPHPDPSSDVPAKTIRRDRPEPIPIAVSASFSPPAARPGDTATFNWEADRLLNTGRCFVRTEDGTQNMPLSGSIPLVVSESVSWEVRCRGPLGAGFSGFGSATATIEIASDERIAAISWPGFDATASVRSGDVDADGDVDLYVTGGENADVIPFLLLQGTSASYEIVSISRLDEASLERLSEFSVAPVKVRVRDWDQDGLRDAELRGVSSVIDGADDLVVFAGPIGDVPSHVTKQTRKLKNFFGQLGSWSANPRFFDDNAPLRVTGVEPPSRRYFGSTFVTGSLSATSILLFLCEIQFSSETCAVSERDPDVCFQWLSPIDEQGNSTGAPILVDVCRTATQHVFRYTPGSVTLSRDYSVFDEDARDSAEVVERISTSCPTFLNEDVDFIQDVFTRIVGRVLRRVGEGLGIDNHWEHAPFPGDEIFAPEDASFHHYDVLTKICDFSDPKCNRASVEGDALRHFSYPSRRLEPRLTALDGTEITAYITAPGSTENPESYIIPAGQITQRRVQSGPWIGAIQNVTQAQHIVFPGTISRIAMPFSDGFYVFTHGVGLNRFLCTPHDLTFGPVQMLFAHANDVYGQKAFEQLDRELIKYWRQ